MINIQNIPLVHEESEEYKEFFSSGRWGTEYLIRPIWKWLPDFDEMDDEEKKKYKLKNMKEGLYLTGMQIISEKWVNKGFCASLFATFGIILDEAYPVEMKKDAYGIQKTMLYLNFEHILFDARGNGTDDELSYTVTS